MSGLMSSWIWNLQLFREVATVVSVPLRVATQYLGIHSNHGLSRVDVEIGVFGIVVRPTRVPIEFQCETGLLLRCDGNVGIPFHTKQGNRPSFEMKRGKEAQIEVCWETRCSSQVGTDMSGNYLSCIKGVEYHFEFQEGRWDFS